ncbi:TonB-dependent receptor domain-containing protein [Campylobacter concisus]
MRLAISLAAAATVLFANGANPDAIKPIKDFTPPPPYTPNVAQSAFAENQFDRAPRDDYFFVTDLLDNSMNKFHVASGFYGRTFYSSGLFKYRGANFYTILNTNFSKANRYKDGGGREWNYGYARQGQSAVVGFVPSELSEFRFTLVHDNIDDDKQPHHTADSIKTQRYIGKFNARLGKEDLSNTLNFEIALRDVSRRNDNYHLRRVDPSSMVKVEVDRKIIDTELKYDVDFLNWHNVVGTGYQHDNHEGKRYRKIGDDWVLNGFRFADVTNKKTRVFDTLSYKFTDAHKLSLALNYDWMKSNLNDLNTVYNGASAINTVAKLIKQIYGKDFDGNIKQNGLSASLKYDFTPNKQDNYYVAIESLYRMPSNMERFSSLYGPTTRGWISNPFIKPERHNRVNLGFTYKSEFYKEYMSSRQGEDSFSVGGYFIADDAQDLIIYDRRHSTAAAPMNKNAVITRNVDARIYSVNLRGEYNFALNFGLKTSLFYNYGQNKTDGRPLYQIRPFEANLAFDYKDYASFGSYNIGTAVRYVAKQNRGDFDKSTGFGIDKREAAKSFTTMDVYGGFEFKNSWGVRLGVTNIFDKDYAEFISGEHVGALDPDPVVRAPGRAVFVSFHANF